MLRRLKLLPMPIQSQTEHELPNRENPYTLRTEPSFAKLRRLNEDPSARKSRTDTPDIFTCEPTIPHSEIELPNCTKLRRESELPSVRKSSTDKLPPKRVWA